VLSEAQEVPPASPQAVAAAEIRLKSAQSPEKEAGSCRQPGKQGSEELERRILFL